MNLFPDNPPLGPAHRRLLSPHLGNARDVKLWIRTNPSTADLKRAVMLEVERGERMRPDVLRSLIVAIQRYERSKIEREILKAQRRVVQKNGRAR